MSDVDLLREAATLMRQRAEAATPGPWMREWAFSTHFVCPESAQTVAADNVSRLHPHQRADAEHIASWHPVVALAAADWLDAEARVIGERRHLAVAFARAYLGGAP